LADYDPVLTPAERAKLAHDRRTYNLSRASLVVSILALAGSFIGPIIAYYWLQSEFRIRELKTRAFTAEGLIEERLFDCEKKRNKEVLYSVGFGNSGDISIDKVRFTLLPAFERDLPENGIASEPPLGFKTEKRGGYVIINFDEAMPPHSNFKLEIVRYEDLEPETETEQFAPSVWLSSEILGSYISWKKQKKIEFACPA
jgi:hypothetical protein